MDTNLDPALLQASQMANPTLSLFVGVAVSFLSAILVYSARQVWEKNKLQNALLAEVKEMEGIEICANQMERIDSPPNRQLSPDDVPVEQSIPTTVYQSTAAKIGLLGGIRGSSELKGAVKFYSKILRYKSIIRKVGSLSEGLKENEDDKDSPIADSDQEALYDNIGKLSDVRDRIIQTGSFNVEYPKEIDSKNTQKD